jgi:hypothetical protein
MFGWTILTPAQAIQQLIQLKHSMHLDATTDQILDIRLNIALQFAQNNVKSGTCIQLTVFIKLVQALQVGHVTSTQATQLIQGAQNIQTTLGCTASVTGVVKSPSAQSSLNSTQSQQQPQITASSPSLMQPNSQYSSPYPYSFQSPRSQPLQAQHTAPIANAGISQTVTENVKVILDGRTSHPADGDTIVVYQWTQLPTGVPVTLTGANTDTPTFTVPVVPTDTVLAFSLRVVDNHGAGSTNPAVVYVMVKHNPHYGPTTGGNTPGTTIIQPQHRLLPNNLLPSPSQPNSLPPQLGSFGP